MKIIVAGLSKTGTKTMQKALSDLGYNVYDAIEHYEYHHKQWKKILEEGGTTEDFRKMYENVDAVTDIPACAFWDLIHQAFPDAKIILMTRDSEDKWWNSMLTQIESTKNMAILLTFMRYFNPTFRSMVQQSERAIRAVGAGELQHRAFRTDTANEMLFRRWYRMHNAYVRQCAPADKLLEFKVSEGWEPLCKFLGVPVPDLPWPHRNKNGSLSEEYLNTHPIFVRQQRELMLVFGLFAAVTGYTVYNVYTKPFEDSVLALPLKVFDYLLNKIGYVKM